MDGRRNVASVLAARAKNAVSETLARRGIDTLALAHGRAESRQRRW